MPQPKPTGSSEAHCDGVVCYAGVDWWYHNRGHSECQIMTRLAARTPVVWVNSIGMRAPAPGKTDLPFRRYARKLKSTLRGIRRDPSGLWIYSPLFFPRYTPSFLALNGFFLNAQTRIVCRSLGIRRPSVWITVPTAEPAVRRRKWVRVVFNRSDDFSSFPEVNGQIIGDLEQSLFRQADDVLYVSQALLKREKEMSRQVHFIDHGVDYEHFAIAATNDSRPPPPSKIRDLPRPIVGYYGALDAYTLDLDLMIKVAKKVSPGTFLLVGPRAMEIGELLAQPNVVYLGPLPYAELPLYAVQFDVGIMPWQQNDWIQGCNPIKLKEYLALGFPIVSIRFPELARYEELLYAADSHDEFLNGIQQALAERDPAMVEKRRQAVINCTWDNLADRVAGLLRIESIRGDD